MSTEGARAPDNAHSRRKRKTDPSKFSGLFTSGPARYALGKEDLIIEPIGIVGHHSFGRPFLSVVYKRSTCNRYVASLPGGPPLAPRPRASILARRPTNLRLLGAFP